MNPHPHDMSILLNRIRTGDESAMPALLELAYSELRAIAGNLFKDQPSDHTLQPTALVNEVCVRLLCAQSTPWNDRKHFVRAAARAMRNLLTDHARAKRTEKRGGDYTVMLGNHDAPDTASRHAPHAVDLIALDETITRLTEVDPRLGQVFELRYLAALPLDRVADILGVSERTVQLDAQFIRAWVQRELVK